MMKDGGQAFPRTVDCISNENKDFDLDGMTLRDYFAGQALSGLVRGKVLEPNDYAFLSYEYADAMLKERE